MKLGELSLFDPRGLFLRTEVIERTSIFRDNDRIEKDRYLFGFEDTNANEVELEEPISGIHIIPVTAEATGNYISGAYQDAGFAWQPYVVKLWLLVEEEPEVISE
jgi:hypothetical protein